MHHVTLHASNVLDPINSSVMTVNPTHPLTRKLENVRAIMDGTVMPHLAQHAINLVTAAMLEGLVRVRVVLLTHSE